MIVTKNDREVVLIIDNTGTNKLVSMMFDTDRLGTGMIVTKNDYTNQVLHINGAVKNVAWWPYQAVKIRWCKLNEG